MSIISKLKGEKKAEEEKKNGGDSPNSSPESSPPRKTWTAEDMRQINRIASRTDVSKSRPTSIRSAHSTRSVRSHQSRSSGIVPHDWAPSQQRSGTASLRMSRNSSYQALEKVMEDGNGDMIYSNGIPPIPPIPSQYSSASLASSSRPRVSRSPFSASGSTVKSALSTADTSPIDSEKSSISSNCSNDGLEMRSHSRPEHFVFGKGPDPGYFDLDPKGKGKGKAPMYASNTLSQPPTSQPVQSYQARPARKWTVPAAPATSEADKVAAAIPAKKNRFSFLKKTEVAA